MGLVEGRGRALLVWLCVALSVTAVVPAAAQAPPQVTFVAGDSTDSGLTVAPGDTVSAFGRGFVPATSGPIRLGTTVESPDVGSYSTGRNGTFETDLLIPRDAPAGRTLLVVCQVQRDGTCAELASTSITIGRTPPTTTSSTTTTTSSTTTSTSSTTSSTTSTTSPPIGISTTTSPPTTSGDIGAGTTSSTTSNPDELSGPSTTLGPDPTAPPNPDGLAVTTTTTLPTDVAAGDIDDDIPNLAITDIEVTQTLQNLDNQFPLVKDRLTVVRVHARTTEDGESQANVTGALRVFRVDGGQHTELGLLFDDNTGPIVLEDSSFRADPDSGPWFALPQQWAHGTLEIQAWIFAFDPAAGNEPTAADNYAQVTVSFDQGRGIDLYYWELYLTEDNDPDGAQLSVDPAEQWLPQQLHVYRQLPVPHVFGHVMDGIVGDASSDWDLSEDSEDMGAPLAALLEMHTLDGRADNDHYVGLVHPDLPTKFGGLAKGLNKPVLWAKWRTWFNGDFPWRHAGGATLAHELGHNMGINHAPCKFEIGDPLPGELEGGAVDPSFPGSYGFPNCSLAPPDSAGYMGWDVAWQLSGMTRPPVFNNKVFTDAEPDYAFPFMGYRYPGWTDPWHGCLVLQFVEVACDQIALGVKDLDAPTGGGGDPGGIPTPGHGVPKFNCDDFIGDDDEGLCNLTLGPSGDPTASEPVDADGYLLVTGVVNTVEETGSLQSILTVPDPATIEPDVAVAGDEVRFVLVFETAEGIVAIRPVVVEGLSGHGGDNDGTEVFVVQAPIVPGLTAVSLRATGGVLDTLGPAGQGPTGGLAVASVDDGLSAPLDLVDPDGDPVLGYLQYRPGPDAPWRTVAARITDDVRTRSTQSLPSSADGQLRLLATDGWTTAISELGGLVVPDLGPRIGVLSPIDGQRLVAGHPTTFLAQADDADDGMLDGDSVEWASDVDGVLGTGASLLVEGLSVGTHEITVMATDSAGNASAATVAIEVGPSDLPDPEVIARLHEVAFRGGSDGSADDDLDGGGAGLAVAVAGVVGLLLVGAAVVARRRRQA